VPSFKAAILDQTGEADAANMHTHGSKIKEALELRREEYLAALHAPAT